MAKSLVIVDAFHFCYDITRHDDGTCEVDAIDAIPGAYEHRNRCVVLEGGAYRRATPAEILAVMNAAVDAAAAAVSAALGVSLPGVPHVPTDTATDGAMPDVLPSGIVPNLFDEGRYLVAGGAIQTGCEPTINALTVRDGLWSDLMFLVAVSKRITATSPNPSSPFLAEALAAIHAELAHRAARNA